MPSSKTKYIAAGLLAAGSAAAVTAYAVRRRKDKAVDKELEVMLDEAEIPAVKPAPAKPAPADAAFKDLMGAKPAEAKLNPSAPL